MVCEWMVCLQQIIEREKVVMHGANYNRKFHNGKKLWLSGISSWRKGPQFLEKLNHGGLYYSYAPQCSELSDNVLETVRGWETMCQATK